MTDPEQKTGSLRYAGIARLGLDSYPWSQCVDCGSDYPHIDGRVSCNGHAIDRCPWCRPDSAPWTAGRGQ